MQTEESLDRAGRALRDATLAFERAMGDDQGRISRCLCWRR
jgi:hypothetical protein